ncbi:hypothetical protein MTR67_034363 [Solanum verrucosum]|uniref:Chromo domain-containing protein n=1 Tax=Solanum verrucosum TaxID=315347 RepID=A0AAF0U854_SOLVR|nr:hypothetical protein MTR67_034363 [Solanum verrucosum]
MKIMDRRMVQKGNKAITQVKVHWVQFPPEQATWQDYHALLSERKRRREPVKVGARLVLARFCLHWRRDKVGEEEEFGGSIIEKRKIWEERERESSRRLVSPAMDGLAGGVGREERERGSSGADLQGKRGRMNYVRILGLLVLKMKVKTESRSDLRSGIRVMVEVGLGIESDLGSAQFGSWSESSSNSNVGSHVGSKGHVRDQLPVSGWFPDQKPFF